MTDLIRRLRDLHMQCDGLSLYAEAADEIVRLRADADRWQFVVRNCIWIRRDDEDDRCSLLAVRLPYDADQSCVATRTNAIDAARAIERAHGIGEAP